MTEEKLYFENSNGIKLCGVLFNPTEDKQRPIIILCHGLASSKDSRTYKTIQQKLNKRGISAFRFDFHGHGESEGNFEEATVSKAVDDILSSIDFIKQKGYKKIGLVGGSFGGIASLIVASKSDDLFVLALKAPVSDLLGKLTAQENKYSIKEWKENGFIYYTFSDGKKLKLNYSYFEDAERINGYEAAKNIKIPTIIVHGEKDESVPVEQSKKTASLIKDCKLEIINGAGHLFSKPEHFEKAINLISRFLIEKSRGIE
ncbi:MAG: alpha/beta fold hydrolase [Candidatus Aenigmarchaeota archaeon]|nr:alpha/beta fold hydrolase [Candidatus Aenigmarchaeota archaeon]